MPPFLSISSLPPGTSLVQILIQLGPDITSDPDTVRAILMRFGISDANPPRDAHVVEIMSNLARLAAEGTTVCDIPALVMALCSFVSDTESLLPSSWVFSVSVSVILLVFSLLNSIGRM
jgi:hypothetical protein